MFTGVQENFAKFTIKMLCQGILNKFTGCRLQYFINDMFCPVILGNFSEQSFFGTPQSDCFCYYQRNDFTSWYITWCIQKAAK